jgi:SAM-dependent methyltransferase
MKRALERALNAVAFAYRLGFTRFVKEAWHRLLDEYYERRLNVDTRYMVTKEALGINDTDAVYYVPISYRALFSMLRRVAVNPQETVFLDYGAGKGRALAVAATFPFKRVLGVEVADTLIAIARRNIDRMKGRRALAVEIEHSDAAFYVVPADVNLIYFFNPFKGKLLERVIANIRASYNECPRHISIIFFNNDFFENAIRGQDWLIKRSQKRLLSYSCGVYETSIQKETLPHERT